MRISLTVLALIASFSVFSAQTCQQSVDAFGNPIVVCTGNP